jgi:hypothetical protein
LQFSIPDFVSAQSFGTLDDLGTETVANILSTLSDQIEDLRSELSLTVELQRGDGCDVTAVAELGSRFADAVRPFLAPELYGSPALPSAFPAVEGAYTAWKAVRRVLDETLNLAYTNAIPRSNLLLDDVRADLIERVGEPLSMSYTDLHRKWRSHLSDRPWDAYQNEKPPAHLDADALERSLGALAKGDELDVEDALGELTGDLRHAFADFIAGNPSHVEDLELNLWKRPEILIAGWPCCASTPRNDSRGPSRRSRRCSRRAQRARPAWSTSFASSPPLSGRGSIVA